MKLIVSGVCLFLFKLVYYKKYFGWYMLGYVSIWPSKISRENHSFSWTDCAVYWQIEFVVYYCSYQTWKQMMKTKARTFAFIIVTILFIYIVYQI